MATTSKPDSALARVRRWRGSVRAFIADNFEVTLDPWQAEVCDAWDRGDIRIAMKACKGPGKTAILAMLMWHFMVTKARKNLMPKIAAISVTSDNLSDNLWTELAKWRNRSEFLRANFTWTKTRITGNEQPDEWFMVARGWSKSADSNSQMGALAGLHADNILFVIDECGDVPDAVMASAEAILATGGAAGKDARILMAGNPTQRSGPLWRACTKDRNLWTVVTITGDPDSPKRSTRISVDWARSQIEQYGRENPWVQANVFGEFPSASPMNFFDSVEVDRAIAREAAASMYDPLVFGVDVARFGDDRSVIVIRKGPDARTHPPIVLRNVDTMALASHVSTLYDRYQPDGVFVDGGGIGAGVIDRLRQLKVPVFDVQFGANADRAQTEKDPTLYRNKRAEMAGVLREWMKAGALPDLPELKQEMSALQYSFQVYKGKDSIILEPKDIFKAREGYSPDLLDALMLTFAYPVQRSANAGREAYERTQPSRVVSDYDPFAGTPSSEDEYNRIVAARGMVRHEYDPYEDVR